MRGDVVDFLLDHEGENDADVMVTSSITQLDDAFRAGLTVDPQSPLLVDMIAPEFRHVDNHWYGITKRLRGFYVSRSAPEWLRSLSYEDLSDPRLRGRICIRSGTHGYNLALFAAYGAHHGRDDGLEWLEGLKSNLARSPEGNDRAQMEAVSRGVCSLAVANSYYYGLALGNHRQRDWAEQIELIFPHFEEGGTHVNISGMAMLSGVSNVEATRAFMEFQLSAEAQSHYARRNFEYPMRPDMGDTDFIASWGAFEGDRLSLQDVADMHRWARDAVAEVSFND